VDRSADINRASWDERAPAHAASAGYSRQQFLDDPSFLSAVVRFDVPLLADIRASHPELELDVHDGGQPHYPLLLAAE